MMGLNTEKNKSVVSLSLNQCCPQKRQNTCLGSNCSETPARKKSKTVLSPLQNRYSLSIGQKQSTGSVNPLRSESVAANATVLPPPCPLKRRLLGPQPKQLFPNALHMRTAKNTMEDVSQGLTEQLSRSIDDDESPKILSRVVHPFQTYVPWHDDAYSLENYRRTVASHVCKSEFRTPVALHNDRDKPQEDLVEIRDSPSCSTDQPEEEGGEEGKEPETRSPDAGLCWEKVENKTPELSIIEPQLRNLRLDSGSSGRQLTRNLEIRLEEKKRQAFQYIKPYLFQTRKIVSPENVTADKPLEEKAVNQAIVNDAFTPLNDEDEADVLCALKGRKRKEVVVMHEESNIEITRELLQCLLPGGWLNDEVINLYLELLKEREQREPSKFLKCHFFNTFFYKKLFNPKSGYDYKAVRRWTTKRKIGYCLSECTKIFIPIHQEIHWCLGIIDLKARKFQYLDSLKGRDQHVMDVLPRYIKDEVKDKTGQDVDVSNWDKEFVQDLPEQENGWDCGMFMLKYVDFYSRGLPLLFSQANMPYFRMRTAKEILKLKAD
eukprot:TRINITY_DN14338_c0_g1_i1.p1 TRINITY_DN14338_c0_g1~~TRINITY_DN14338_c0_g1_i1.p1  ORF type:complete len:548 (-),score=77.67 TRINITY_DN14338_c0_g1_i1:46-1689(-)